MFSDHIPGATPEAIDLLGQILVFDPKTRITAADALKHAYFEEYTDDMLADELACKLAIEPFDGSFAGLCANP